MKTFLLPLACAASLAVAVPAHADNNAGRNMLLGGIAGAIIGDNNHHQAAEGAIIGASAGLLFSAITDNHDGAAPCHPVVVTRPYCPPTRVVVVQPAPYRDVAVVRPPCRPAPRVVVVTPGYSHDRRGDRHERRADRRDDGRHDRADNRYAYNR